MLRYTAKVRRGFEEMIRRKLLECIEEIITKHTSPSLPRSKRMTAAEVSDLRAAGAWIAQEASHENNPDRGSDSPERPPVPTPPPAAPIN